MPRQSRQEHLLNELRKDLTRRWFFKECGVGLGAIALGQLLGGNAPAGSTASADPLAPKSPHFSPKVKRVIYLFMAGGPSQLELFDHKPELAKWGGKLPPRCAAARLPRGVHRPEREAAGAQVHVP